MDTREFEDFIKTNYTEDTGICLFEIINTIKEFDLIENLHDLMNILMQDQLVNKQDLVDQFRTKLEDIAVAILKSHGITISDEATVFHLNELIKGLLELPFYIDKQVIVDIAQSSLDVKTKFTDLFTLVCNLSDTDIFTIVEEVDFGLIQKLFMLVNEQQSTEQVNELNTKIIQKLQQLKLFLQDELPSAFVVIENGRLLGSNFESYFDLIEKDETISPYKIAKNVLVVLTMSKEGYDNPIVTYKNNSDHLFTSLDTITKVDVQIIRLLQEFEKFKINSGIKNG